MKSVMTFIRIIYLEYVILNLQIKVGQIFDLFFLYLRPH